MIFHTTVTGNILLYHNMSFENNNRISSTCFVDNLQYGSSAQSNMTLNHLATPLSHRAEKLVGNTYEVRWTQPVWRTETCSIFGSPPDFWGYMRCKNTFSHAEPIHVDSRCLTNRRTSVSERPACSSNSGPGPASAAPQFSSSPWSSDSQPGSPVDAA